MWKESLRLTHSGESFSDFLPTRRNHFANSTCVMRECRGASGWFLNPFRPDSNLFRALRTRLPHPGHHWRTYVPQLRHQSPFRYTIAPFRYTLIEIRPHSGHHCPKNVLRSHIGNTPKTGTRSSPATNTPGTHDEHFVYPNGALSSPETHTTIPRTGYASPPSWTRKVL